MKYNLKGSYVATYVCMYIRTYIVHSISTLELSHIYVTGFAKTIPIGTTIEIHFMA